MWHFAETKLDNHIFFMMKENLTLKKLKLFDFMEKIETKKRYYKNTMQLWT